MEVYFLGKKLIAKSGLEDENQWDPQDIGDGRLLDKNSLSSGMKLLTTSPCYNPWFLKEPTTL